MATVWEGTANPLVIIAQSVLPKKLQLDPTGYVCLWSTSFPRFLRPAILGVQQGDPTIWRFQSSADSLDARDKHSNGDTVLGGVYLHKVVPPSDVCWLINHRNSIDISWIIMIYLP